MTSEETITMTRKEYEALIERNSQLEDMLAAQEADDGVRVPHEVALDIMGGKGPILAFRNHLGITLRELSEKTGIAVGTSPRLSVGENRDRPRLWPASPVRSAPRLTSW